MPSSDASNPANGQTVRRTRLNPDRLERKRATDRETQRAIRAKTKSYIEHLESTVQRYEQSTGDDLTRELATKVSEQHLEISRLQEVVKNAHKILKLAISGEDANEQNDSQLVPSNGDIPGQAIEASPAWTADGASNVQDRTCSSNVPPDDISNVPLKLHEVPSPETVARQPIQPELSPSENPLACGDGDGNYLELLSKEMTNLQNDSSFCPLTSAEEDEDVTIRAIFASWDSTEERHRLDPVWKLLKALDQGLFYRSGPVERVAVLRLMRSMLLYRINPFWQHPTPQLPSYMMPCEEQLNCHHLSLVDFFAWPSLRAFLITRSVTYLPEYSAALFAEHLNFRWQYEPEDVFMTHQSTGRYVFSDTFRYGLEDLATWSLNEPFFRFAPWLTNIIPANKHRCAAVESNG